MIRKAENQLIKIVWSISVHKDAANIALANTDTIIGINELA